MENTWQTLFDLLRAGAPELLDAVSGVPIDEIRKAEARWGIEFPQFYVDFLCTVGRHRGESPFFPADHIHDFERSADAYDPAAPFARRYFCIAAHTGEHDVAYLEIFLDLDTSDGLDCGLVQFEEGGPELSPDTVFPMQETLAQYMSDLIPRLLLRS